MKSVMWPNPSVSTAPHGMRGRARARVATASRSAWKAAISRSEKRVQMSPLVAYQGWSGCGQMRGGVLEAAAAAQRLRLDDGRARAAAVRRDSSHVLEHLGEMTAGDDDVRHALGGQPGQLMADDRGPGAGDLDHRLGTVVGVRAQPRALAAGQDHGLRRDAGVMHAANVCGAGWRGPVTTAESPARRRGGRRLRRQCVPATPVAKEVSQTGREKTGRAWGRTGRRRRGRGRGRWTCSAWRATGAPSTACWRWVSATPGSFSWSSASSRSRSTSCGARATWRVADDVLGGGGEHLRLGGRAPPRGRG